ncbi:MAG: helix-turn-helix domain-containing protein [Pirellulales bacterium]
MGDKTIVDSGLHAAVFSEKRQAANQQIANQAAPDAEEDDPEAALKKLMGDIDLWYERHDATSSKTEKDAAWRRIVALQERRDKLEEELRTRPKVRPVATRGVTREAIRRFVDELATAIPKLRDNGVGLIKGLVEHHGLNIRFRDGDKLLISLALCPPSMEEVERAVPVEAEVKLPRGEVDEWLRQHAGKVVCEHCGEPIEVRRRHFWMGLPKFHYECVLALNVQRRVRPEKGFLNGQQVAERLGVGRTTVGRWIRSGKLVSDKKVGGVHLFAEKRINNVKDSKVGS